MAQADIYYGNPLLLPEITGMQSHHSIGFADAIESRVSDNMFFYLAANISRAPVSGQFARSIDFGESSSDPAKSNSNVFPIFNTVLSEGADIQGKLPNLNSYSVRVTINLDPNTGNGNEELYVENNLVTGMTTLEIPLTDHLDYSEAVKCYVKSIDGTQATSVDVICHKVEFIFRRTQRRLLETGEVEEEILHTDNTQHVLVKIHVK